jgi:hypothetical protein
VRIADDAPIVPHAPPPDIDLEAWEASLGLVRSWAPTSLALPHFGIVNDPLAHVDQMLRALRGNAELAQRVSREAFVKEIDGRVLTLDPEIRDAYMLNAAAPHSYDGFTRYWTRRAEVSDA